MSSPIKTKKKKKEKKKRDTRGGTRFTDSEICASFFHTCAWNSHERLLRDRPRYYHVKETFFSLISMPAYFNIHIYAFRALLSVDYPSLFCAFSAVFSNVQGHYHARLDHEPDHDGTITDNGRIQLILFLARSLSIGVHDRLSVGFFFISKFP